MARLSWPVRPLPDRRGDEWRFELASVAQLPAARAVLRDRLDAVAADCDDPEGTGECLVLAFDELASNALRHGEVPVVATVVAGRDGWLLDVSDRAPDALPTPAVDRDPAQGGLGLHLVARMAAAHGWFVDGGRKHVWATLAPAADGAEPALA